MVERSRVSVIVPAFNAAGTIEQAIRSALAQRLSADEVIVVDDGSSDATPAILARLAAADRRLRVLRQDNAGPAAARNRAIGEACGGLIAPLDADDLWHPDYLADMVAALDRSAPPAGFAYALYRVIDADGRIVRDGGDYGVCGRAELRHLLVNFVGSGSNAVFRRDAMVAAGLYDARTRDWGGAEDYLLQLRIARTWPVARVGRRLVGYRRSGASYSSDPAAAWQARTMAVAQILAEGASPAAPVRRWARADAARTRAVALLQNGEAGGAIGWGVRALVADPVATLAEIRQRLANAVRRRFGHPAAGAAPKLFLAASPDVHLGSLPDPVTRRRLARLGRAER